MRTNDTVHQITMRETASRRIAAALTRSTAPLAAAACRLRPRRRRAGSGIGGLNDWVLRDIGVPRSELQRQGLT